mmetsp:Transcript_91375/g.263091  ORF Transcript_91375/g.263091 Transcript_91375/m.263091 type:complete len:304 (+) Transcript_91375:1398-2309(+)
MPTSLSFKSSRSSSASIFFSRCSLRASSRATAFTTEDLTLANLASSSAFSRASAMAFSLALSKATCICANSCPVLSMTVETTLSMTSFLSAGSACTRLAGNGMAGLRWDVMLLLPLPTWLTLPLPLAVSLTLSKAARLDSVMASSTLSSRTGVSRLVDGFVAFDEPLVVLPPAPRGVLAVASALYTARTLFVVPILQHESASLRVSTSMECSISMRRALRLDALLLLRRSSSSWTRRPSSSWSRGSLLSEPIPLVTSICILALANKDPMSWDSAIAFESAAQRGRSDDAHLAVGVGQKLQPRA